MNIRSGALEGAACKGLALATCGSAAIAVLGPLGALAYVGLGALKNELQAKSHYHGLPVSHSKDTSTKPLGSG